ncbi:MAG TPA: hypothetical protein VE687_15860 [Stellaceae bacterium]|nr:hypothetical protein [Stellaceae bacterium]
MIAACTACAAVDLILGDLVEAVVVVGEQQLLGLARALRVHALADQRGAGVLHQRRRGDHARDVRGAARRARAGVAALDAVGQHLNVRRRGAAAPPDDRDAVTLDELAQDGRQRLGLLGEDRLAVGPLLGQAGVGDAVHGDRTELAQEADRVTHVLGAGRAVQPDHVGA